jgi:hypothetical protein
MTPPAARRTQRVRVGQHLKLEHRLDAEQHAGRRARRFVVDVADVGAVEEKAVVLRAAAVDGDFRRAAAHHVAARGDRRRDARLEQRQLLE